MKTRRLGKMLKKMLVIALGATLTLGASLAAGCQSGFNAEKNITVVARDNNSGTREAFDTVVTADGVNYLMMKENGQKVFYTTDKANFYEKTGVARAAVSSDPQAIGYISLGSVDDSIKVVKVNGVAPSKETVLDGTYKIQRPFVIMTNKSVTLTKRTADFVKYLHSSSVEADCEAAGVIFLKDPAKRANEGEPAIEVGEAFVKDDSLTDMTKIVVRGSTSMEEVITKAAKSYADIYGADPSALFDVQLQGSSVGRKAVEGDTTGNVIGLSSAAVKNDKLNSFNVCLDAVAVIVNKQNELINDLTLADLYKIYTGAITKFSGLSK
ncbi:MAG: substrate-binding domain-containing protein [Candidatus Borkfalkiaceae bacterium]|nr:substrate-binding domain-containing protein [Christensenellaceae bacterium]